MDDATWARIEAKRERNAYFNRLNKAAKDAREKRPGPVSTARLEQNGHKEPRPPRYIPTGRKPTGRPRRTPEDCVACGAKLRLNSQSAADHPGTKRHYGHGLCINCWRARRKEDH